MAPRSSTHCKLIFCRHPPSYSSLQNSLYLPVEQIASIDFYLDSVHWVILVCPISQGGHSNRHCVHSCNCINIFDHQKNGLEDAEFLLSTPWPSTNHACVNTWPCPLIAKSAIDSAPEHHLTDPAGKCLGCLDPGRSSGHGAHGSAPPHFSLQSIHLTWEP